MLRMPETSQAQARSLELPLCTVGAGHHFNTVNVLKGSLLASYTWKFLRKQVIFLEGGVIFLPQKPTVSL